MNEEVKNEKNKKKFDMSIIKNTILKNKRLFTISVGAVVIVLIGIIVIPKMFTSNNNEKTLQTYLEEMGRDFYENYYYERTGKTDEERKEFLKKYSSTGIKIDLENLARYNGQVNKEKVDSFVNSTTDEACDKKETKVTIIPKDDYRKTDYDLKIDLVCGSFE